MRTRKFWLAGLIAMTLGGCTAATVSFINQVLLDVQTVCHAIIDDSNGAIEQIIATLPFGTTAEGAAMFICNFINAVPPLATSAALMQHAQVTLPNSTQVTVNFTKGPLGHRLGHRRYGSGAHIPGRSDIGSGSGFH